MAIVIKVQYKEPKAEHQSRIARAVINYCLQPHKTKLEHNVYAVAGQNCTPELAFEQAGKLSEKASERITKRILTDDALWGLRFVLAILPTLLVLALSVYMGWLPFFQG